MSIAAAAAVVVQVTGELIGSDNRRRRSNRSKKGRKCTLEGLSNFGPKITFLGIAARFKSFLGRCAYVVSLSL